MKKIFLFLPVLLAMCIVSCSKNDDDVARQYTVNVTVTPPAGINLADIQNLTVTAVNRQTSAEEVINPQNGIAAFLLNSGEYDFRASGATGVYSVNGLKSQVAVYEDQSVQLPLNISAGSGIIFKEVYFTGVKDYYFKDGFYEIYNNSNEIQYLDGVILGIVDEGLPVNVFVPSPSIWVDENGELLDRYPMANYTMYFPGNGKDYPLNPGESVVIAANPINHKTAHPTTETDVQSPVDLSHAHWELFCGPYSATDTDIDGIPNLNYAFHTFGLDFMPSTSGQALILAKLPEGMKVADFVASENNFMTAPGKDSKHLMIPAQYVIDGIEIVRAPVNERFKNLRASEDVGMTWVDGSDNGTFGDSAYCGKSLRRKVIAINNGHPVYKDTNNSSEDFLTGGSTPTPGIHPTVVD